MIRTIGKVRRPGAEGLEILRLRRAAAAAETAGRIVARRTIWTRFACLVAGHRPHTFRLAAGPGYPVPLCLRCGSWLRDADEVIS